MSYYGGSSGYSSPYVPYDHPAPPYSGECRTPSSSSSGRSRSRSMSRSMSPFTSPPPGSRPGSSSGGGSSPFGFMGPTGSTYGRSSGGGSIYGGGSMSSGSIDYSGYRNMYNGSPFGTPMGSVHGGSRRSSLSSGSSHSSRHSSSYGDDIFGSGRYRRAGAPSPDRGIGGGSFAPNYTPGSFGSGSSMTENMSAYGGMPSYGLGPPPSRARSSRSSRPSGEGSSSGAFTGFRPNKTPGTYGEQMDMRKRPRAPSSSGSSRPSYRRG